MLMQKNIHGKRFNY